MRSRSLAGAPVQVFRGWGGRTPTLTVAHPSSRSRDHVRRRIVWIALPHARCLTHYRQFGPRHRVGAHAVSRAVRGRDRADQASQQQYTTPPPLAHRRHRATPSTIYSH
jgi:hypothetical protein